MQKQPGVKHANNVHLQQDMRWDRLEFELQHPLDEMR